MKSIFIILAIALASMVAHAVHWDNWKNSCNFRRHGHRTHDAVLWSIPWGHSWEAECEKHGANIGGKWYGKPSRCVKSMSLAGTARHMHGEFDVVDSSCTLDSGLYTNWHSHCTPNKRGYRTHKAIMVGVPPEVACAVAAANINTDGHGESRLSKPARCTLVDGYKLQVEYDVPSNKC
jgi:hypothetical protein